MGEGCLRQQWSWDKKMYRTWGRRDKKFSSCRKISWILKVLSKHTFSFAAIITHGSSSSYILKSVCSNFHNLGLTYIDVAGRNEFQIETDRFLWFDLTRANLSDETHSWASDVYSICIVKKLPFQAGLLTFEGVPKSSIEKSVVWADMWICSSVK